MNTSSDTFRSLHKVLNAPKSKYQPMQVTDLMTGAKTWVLFRRGTAGREPPIAGGFATRQEAEARGRELEAEEPKP